jgi:hypothetical protein
MKLLRSFVVLLTSWFLPKPGPKRISLKDVKPGDSIRIEWDRIFGKIGFLKCINNDPKTRKILLEARWNNAKQHGLPEKELIVFSYNCKELINFHLLNEQKFGIVNADEDTDEHDIAGLQRDLNKALDAQEYEKAREIQNKIDKLVNKNKNDSGFKNK